MNVMDLSYFISLIDGFGLCNTLIAAIAIVAAVILEKTLLKNKGRKFYALLPFATAVVMSLIGCLVRKGETSVPEAISDGASVGAAATAAYAILKGFLKGDFEDVPIDSLIIEGLLAGYLPEEELAAFAEECAVILREELSEEERFKKLCDRIVLARNDISLAEAQMLAKIILNVISAAK